MKNYWGVKYLSKICCDIIHCSGNESIGIDKITNLCRYLPHREYGIHEDNMKDLSVKAKELIETSNCPKKPVMFLTGAEFVRYIEMSD